MSSRVKETHEILNRVNKTNFEEDTLSFLKKIYKIAKDYPTFEDIIFGKDSIFSSYLNLIRSCVYNGSMESILKGVNSFAHSYMEILDNFLYLQSVSEVNLTRNALYSMYVYMKFLSNNMLTGVDLKGLADNCFVDNGDINIEHFRKVIGSYCENYFDYEGYERTTERLGGLLSLKTDYEFEASLIDVMDVISSDLIELKKDFTVRNRFYFNYYNYIRDIMVEGKTNFFYYNSSLLIDKRLEYLNDKLKTLGDVGFKSDIGDKICSLGYQFFDKFTRQSAFNEIMDNVFDSDTFDELENKLDFLIETKEAYDEKNNSKIDLYQMLSHLNDDSLKPNLDGRVVKFSFMTMNKVDKPPLLVDRMKKTYSNFRPDVNFDRLTAMYKSNESLRKFNELFNYGFKETSYAFIKK